MVTYLQLNSGNGVIMRKRLTQDLVYEMIDKSKKTFYDSDRSEIEKAKLQTIIPYIHFNNRLKSCYGTACLVHTRSRFTKKHNLSSIMDPVTIQGRKSFFVMDLAGDLQLYPKHEVYETVAHELAHLLDFCFAGYYTRSKRWHHNGWKELLISMGGTGYISGPITIEDQKRAQNQKSRRQ